MLTLSLVLAVLIGADPPKPAPAPFLTIRIVDPKTQGERLLALFEGARAPHPAAALAGYRRAHNGDSGLSKAAEAGLAALNPRMFAELPLLNDMTIELKRRADGQLGWNAVILHDDGSFGALGTAFALTDGATLTPIDGATVDRLGPAGAPLLAQNGHKLVVAGTAADLAAGLTREPALSAKLPSGIHLQLDPARMTSPDDSLATRRVGEALIAAGLKNLESTIGLQHEGFQASVRGDLSCPAVVKATIDPKWLVFPTDSKTLVVFAFAIDSSPESWDALFGLVDRVEKVDPTHANVAPARLRVNLLLSAAKIKPEVDLYPVLKGLSGFVSGDEAGKPGQVVIRFHLKDATVATKFAEETLPKLATSFRLSKPTLDMPATYLVAKKPLAITSKGAMVSLTWGESTSSEVSLGVAPPWLESIRVAGLQRTVVFWPGRLPSLAVPDAAPIVWTGSNDGTQTLDVITCYGLKTLTRTIVDRLPLDPPTDIAKPVAGKPK